MKLKDRIAVITGGGSGIGRAIALAFAELFLASDDSSFYTGQWRSPNGGVFIG